MRWGRQHQQRQQQQQRQQMLQQYVRRHFGSRLVSKGVLTGFEPKCYAASLFALSGGYPLGAVAAHGGPGGGPSFQLRQARTCCFTSPRTRRRFHGGALGGFRRTTFCLYCSCKQGGELLLRSLVEACRKSLASLSGWALGAAARLPTWGVGTLLLCGGLSAEP